jgi:hypothetical protein
MDFDKFWTDIITTLVGGSALTFLFFLAREKLFPIPDVTGKWYLEMKTVNTAYNPYQDMVLRYVLMIWREGNIIKGSAEKIYENSSTGERDYVGENRTRARIEGYIEKNYLGRDRVYIHSIENGHGRESTNIYDLLLNPNGKMVGSFHSMVANQDGTAIYQRESF